MSKYYIAVTSNARSKITSTEVSCDTFNKVIRLVDTVDGMEDLTVKINSLGHVVAHMDVYSETVTEIRKALKP